MNNKERGSSNFNNWMDKILNTTNELNYCFF